MSEPFIGEINLFAGNFAPRGWHFCDGTLLDIASYQALFSLLSTTYGGDGRTNFALPDLRGRVPLSPGQAPGLNNYRLGQKGGSETVTLTANQTATHSHSLMAFTTASSLSDPTGNVLAQPGRTGGIYQTDASSNLVNMSTAAIGDIGSGQAHENRQPYLACYYIIALEGVYPQRS
ncbi:MAG: tail fiber protein [Cyanobacteria bacterium P01_G01_bin.49]